MNVLLRSILISMLLLASPLRDAHAGVGGGTGASPLSMSDAAQALSEALSDLGMDGATDQQAPDSLEEADEAVIDSERHVPCAGLNPAPCKSDDTGPQCATAQATRPPNTI